jgi:hypothetical protein
MLRKPLSGRRRLQDSKAKSDGLFWFALPAVNQIPQLHQRGIHMNRRPRRHFRQLLLSAIERECCGDPTGRTNAFGQAAHH